MSPSPPETHWFDVLLPLTTIFRVVVALFTVAAGVVALFTDRALVERTKPLKGFWEVLRDTPLETRKLTPWGWRILAILALAGSLQFVGDWLKDQKSDQENKRRIADLTVTISDAVTDATEASTKNIKTEAQNQTGKVVKNIGDQLQPMIKQEQAVLRRQKEAISASEEGISPLNPMGFVIKLEFDPTVNPCLASYARRVREALLTAVDSSQSPEMKQKEAQEKLKNVDYVSWTDDGNVREVMFSEGSLLFPGSELIRVDSGSPFLIGAVATSVTFRPNTNDASRGASKGRNAAASYGWDFDFGSLEFQRNVNAFYHNANPWELTPQPSSKTNIIISFDRPGEAKNASIIWSGFNIERNEGDLPSYRSVHDLPGTDMEILVDYYGPCSLSPNLDLFTMIWGRDYTSEAEFDTSDFIRGDAGVGKIGERRTVFKLRHPLLSSDLGFQAEPKSKDPAQQKKARK